MVVGSKGPAAAAGPEIPAGPIDDRGSREAGESPEGPAVRFREIFSDEVASPDDLVHVALPLLEHARVRGLDAVQDPPDALPDHGCDLPGVDDREVEIATPLDHDPVVAEVELVQLAVLAVHERVAYELGDRRQHAAEDVLVLVLRQAAGQVVQEDTIAVDQEDLLDLGAESADHREDQERRGAGSSGYTAASPRRGSPTRAPRAACRSGTPRNSQSRRRPRRAGSSRSRRCSPRGT